jgi:uncharacterized protein YpmB
VDNLTAIFTMEGYTTMAALDDLKAADQQLQTDVGTLKDAAATNATAVQSAIDKINQLQASGGISDADAEAIVSDLQGAHTGVSDATNSVVSSAGNLSNAVTPTVTPPVSG